jgi:4-methylaminobutanoate oxidase (formaldehyde-forming)
MKRADIVVVGGGIWGLSTALHLAWKDPAQRIVVLERNAEFADETTRQAAGQIGQLRSDPLMAEAVQYTRNLVATFRERTGHDPGFVESGSLHLAQSDARMESFLLQLQHARSLGIDVEDIDGDSISRIAPTINARELVGALYIPSDGYVDARKTALAYGAAAKDLGVELRPNTEIQQLILRNGRVAGVETNEGMVECRGVVVTAGQWTRSLAALAGVPLPVQAIRLQQARTVADVLQPHNHPVVRIPDESCYLRPELGGYLFGFFDAHPEAIDATRGMTTADILPPKHVIEYARERLAKLFPALDRLPIEQYRQGMVTCSPDAAYVLGPLPGVAGVWLATGCGGMGIAGSGAVGRWLADWVLDGKPSADLSSLAVDRFGKRAQDRAWVREEARRVCSRYYALESVTYSLG